METLKHFALKVLPESLLQALKKRHYLRVIQDAILSDEPDLFVARNLVANGDVALDIGANIGLYTKFLSEMVGATGVVCSVEPIPPTFAILRANVSALGLSNVQLEHCAVGESAGSARMHVPRYASGGGNYYRASLSKPENSDEAVITTFEVPVRSGDELFRAHAKRVSFVRVDVEGHEQHVLRGATELLRAGKAAWLIEVSGDPDKVGSAAEQVFLTMLAEGYGPYLFDGIALRKRRVGDTAVNYFFLKNHHLKRVEEMLR